MPPPSRPSVLEPASVGAVGSAAAQAVRSVSVCANARRRRGAPVITALLPAFIHIACLKRRCYQPGLLLLTSEARRILPTQCQTRGCGSGRASRTACPRVFGRSCLSERQRVLQVERVKSKVQRAFLPPPQSSRCVNSPCAAALCFPWMTGKEKLLQNGCSQRGLEPCSPSEGGALQTYLCIFSPCLYF